MHATLVRNIAIVIFLGLIMLCIVEFKNYQELDEAQQADGIIKLILYFIATAVFGGLMFVFYVLPTFGDAVGEAMLSSAEEADADPYLKARGKIAIGDYEAAVAEFREIAKENPEDRMPVSEIVKLYLERLHDPANAELVLENAIRDDHWGPDDASWFIFKLVDLIQIHQPDNQDRVVNLLQKVMRRYPKTRYSANAIHRLREIDPQLVASFRAQIEAEQQQVEDTGESGGVKDEGDADLAATPPAASTTPRPNVNPPSPTRQEPPKPNV